MSGSGAAATRTLPGPLGEREMLSGPDRLCDGPGLARQESKPCCCTGGWEPVASRRGPSRRVETAGVSVHVRNHEICDVVVQRGVLRRSHGAGSRESCCRWRTPRAGSAGSPASARAGGVAGTGRSARRSGAWRRGGAVRVHRPRLSSDVLMPRFPRRGREVGGVGSPIAAGGWKSG